MTVRELKTYLSGFPDDAEVYIDDADTNWLLPVQPGPDQYGYAKVPNDRPIVVIHGNYGEQIG